MKKLKTQKAQTALELAVFGAILIFVMGTIIRTTTARSLQQHSLLRATRMALTMSYQSTLSKQVSGRNMATVLIVEDRLSADSGKYGAIDRMPFMMHGSGTHSPNLFMPVDYGDNEDLPVFDLFVNGKRFPFTTSAYKEVRVARECANENPCPDECVGPNACAADSLQYYPGENIDPDTQWEPNCVKYTKTTTLKCANAAPCPAACSNGCGPLVVDTYDITESVDLGCGKFFTVVDNHPLVEKWCASNSDPGCAGEDLDLRFDLDRDGTTDVSSGERPYFAWQWLLVMGVEDQWWNRMFANPEDYSIDSLRADPDGSVVSVISEGTLINGEGIILPGGETDPKNAILDVDNDLKLEYIMANVGGGLSFTPSANTLQPNLVGKGGIIMRLGVQDPQEGDIDLSYNTPEELRGEPKYGFDRDVKLYTFVNDDSSEEGGTYLEIDEGKLYNNSKQYIRTASKKDSVDIVERTFHVSKNTGRYCGAYTITCDLKSETEPTDWSVVNYFCEDIDGDGVLDRQNVKNITAGELILGLKNPVEICAHTPAWCFTSENMNRTCMDMSTNTIFIRSRVKDVHGRKWVTDESQDPYVELNVNN